MSGTAGRVLREALEAASPAAPMDLAWRLGFAGAAARLTGLPDPRPPAEVAYTRLLAVERRDVVRRVSTALRAADVRHCFVKGAAMGARYQPGERDADDADLLVAWADVAKGTEVLTRCGYRPEADAEAAAPVAMRRGLSFAAAGPLTPWLDVQWGLTAVNRLLSDSDAAVLDRLWDHVEVESDVAVPAAEWHVPLLVHHLVHHDLQHGRAVVDLLLMGEQLDPAGQAAARSIATTLRVRRVLDAWMTACDARRDGRSPSHGVAALLDPARLLRLADTASPADHERITPRRVWRRLRLLDQRRDAWRVVRDIAAPPDVYLRWRWPGATTRMARWSRHVRRTIGKLMFRS